MTGPLVSRETSLYSVINGALQIKLLQAKVARDSGETDTGNTTLFLPNFRALA